MRLTTILILAMFTFFSCKKEKGGEALDGKWKMIKYYDRNDNAFHTKPDTSTDVFLVIDGDKYSTLSGLQPMSEGTYFLFEKDISFNPRITFFPVVTNDQWTDMFSWAIVACQLQSAYPCSPSKLEYLSSNQIRINTPLRMDIVLMKVR